MCKRHFLVLSALALGLSTAATSLADSAERLRFLQQIAPDVQVYQENGLVSRLYGTGMSFGASAAEAAERFLLEQSEIFGVTPDELAPEGFDGSADPMQPVLYQPATDSYKFQLFRYAQTRDGIPVFRADLRILVRNELDFPVVLTAAHLFDLGGFSIGNQPLTHPALVDIAPDMDAFDAAEFVIYAGVEKQIGDPVLAVSFIATRGDKNAGDYERWLYVADAATGEILYRESQIHNVDVNGNVSGWITPNFAARACASPVVTPMPYARVSIGGTTAFADANGDFVIPNGGSGGVTVNSTVRGLYFNVNNQAGSDASLNASVTPPGPANFVHNASQAEQTSAEVDAYYHANVVRDFALSANPSYPTIATQTDWPVNVNLNDTCNAYYDGVSINFFLAGGGCNNTAFSDVVHHEYGHHLVNVGGSGQGEYGEGMGDVVGMLITGHHELGIGFQSCGSGIRDAQNAMQYPCSGEIHFCGQLISGCVWDTWQELLVTEPANADDIIRDLAVNAILLHSGTSITPTITVDYLTLDDDDADIGNGTPHDAEILTGFGNHNMAPQPPPANDAIANAIEACPGAYAGSTTFATVDGNSTCATSSGSPDVWYAYTPQTNGTLTASLCDAGTNYDAAISIHSGAPGNTGNELACDDDGCGTTGGPATASTSVTSGLTYYIRVTGWSGSVGNYVLNISGPACAPTAPLSINLPNGAPNSVSPTSGATFDVQIADVSETYATGTAQVHYRFDGGAYLTAALSDLGGGSFSASLPAGACGQTAEFYVSAESTIGSVVTSPATAPASVYAAPVGLVDVLIADNFETDMGWTTDPGSASSGQWQRGVPVNDPSWAYDPASDSDGSGQCYLTQNQAGNTDVDGGDVLLISPVIDMSAGNVTIEYDYYLYLTDASGLDWLRLAISSNGTAGPWTNIAEHNTDGGLGWRHHTITQTELDSAGVVLGANMALRFRAIDADPQSIVEAGVDALRISTFTCGGAPPCLGDLDGDFDIDLTDLALLLSDFDCSGGCVGDVDGDGDTDLTDLAVLLSVFEAPC